MLQLILEGKNAIITGGNSGIGEAIAELFSSEGASIAITGRNEIRGEKVVSNIEQKGGKAFFVQTDVSQSNSVDKMFDACFEKFPQIDILVNNAGVQIMKTLENLSENDWDNHSSKFFDKMKSMDGVRLPGERRHQNRKDKGPRNINEELINKIKSLS